MMKIKLTTAIAILTTIAISLPAQAENPNDLNQLLSTKKCAQCDLSNAGLVMANLIGSDLSGANLVNANLSQANLAGANLAGANLSGASLNGVNLTGANLTGANLTGTDLRNSYLTNANLNEVDLDTAYLDGVRGIANSAATPEQFHRWGVREAERGNYTAAIAHYNRAIELDPEFAPAYLGLSLIQYRFDNRASAEQNVSTAAKLFKKQKHELGYKTATDFKQKMLLASQIEADTAKRERGAGNFGKFLGGVGSLLLQLML
jgi:tetratricopeptide (TPR) repeat protein